ncbi:MAG TPA: hypothetical protein ENJ77_00210 [Candidatus Moranbacteria bacterium]|nr:hypothetical protein [Candidatus Moranbacteria bacterium]
MTPLFPFAAINIFDVTQVVRLFPHLREKRQRRSGPGLSVSNQTIRFLDCFASLAKTRICLREEPALGGRRRGPVTFSFNQNFQFPESLGAYADKDKNFCAKF